MKIAVRSLVFIFIICLIAFFFSATHDRDTHLTHFSFLSDNNMLSVAKQTDVEGWNFSAKPYSSYRYDISTNEAHEGNSSLFIVNKLPSDDGNAEIRQTISVDNYINSTISLTAYIKTKHLQGKASIALELLNNSGFPVRKADVSYLPSDNTEDWQKVQLTAKITEDIKSINFSGQLHGSGQVWFDSFKLAKVSSDAGDDTQPAPYRSSSNQNETPARKRYLDIIGYHAEPSNEAFIGSLPVDAEKWLISEYLVNEYQFSSENKTLQLKSVRNDVDFGVFFKRFYRNNIEAKQIRFSAQIKHQYVESLASIWMRIEDKDKNTIAFANLRYSQTGGSSSWQDIEVILP